MENVNLREVDELIARHKAGGGGLIELLQQVSAHYQFVPREVVERISESLDVPLTQLYSLATFYQSFKLSPPGKHQVCVCTGTACYVRGAPRLLDALRDELKVEPGETTPDGEFTLATVNCLGTCAIGPVVTLDGQYHANLSPDGTKRLVRDVDEIQAAQAKAEACCGGKGGARHQGAANAPARTQSVFASTE
ncbi:MAG: NAD(P)H-dependent oxidoreductase subunit E, partial [Patescibacteria group bacterium]|nr:NAD(P)H-dependent oxidoreductase subunit E [Patescibacteria group bacterium]